MTSETLEKLELAFGSELPTNVNPARSQAAARVAARALADEALTARQRPAPAPEPERAEQEMWCDSEAPTGVAAERPLLPRPPRNPRV